MIGPTGTRQTDLILSSEEFFGDPMQHRLDAGIDFAVECFESTFARL